MSITDWIILGIWLMAQLSAIIVLYINIRVQITKIEKDMEALKEKVQTNLHDFHIHEQQNEKMFDKFEKKQDKTLTAISELKGIIIEKLH